MIILRKFSYNPHVQQVMTSIGSTGALLQVLWTLPSLNVSSRIWFLSDAIITLSTPLMINLGSLSQMSPLEVYPCGESSDVYNQHCEQLYTLLFLIVKIISRHSLSSCLKQIGEHFWKLFNCGKSRFYIFQHINLIILNTNFHCEWYRVIF